MRCLVIFLSIIFAVSLAYSLYFHVQPSVDARAYDRIGWNLAQGLGYRESLDGPLIQDNAILRVGPGYEFFLAGTYIIFGHRYVAVWILHALLLTASALLTYLLVRRLFAFLSSVNTVALIAAGLVGFSPDLITVNGLLMAETLGVFLGMFTVWIFFVYNDRQHWWLAALVGFSLAAATMVRTPLGLLFFPLIFFFLYRRRWLHVAVCIAAIALSFTPWVMRNYSLYRAFVPTNLAYGVDLAAGNHSGATGELEPYPLNDIYLERYGIVEGNTLLTKSALSFIATHPLEFLKLTLYRISIYFSFARPSAFWFHLSGVSRLLTLIFSVIYALVLFVLSFFGFWGIRLLEREKRERALLLLAFLVMMPLAVVGVIVETRYRFLAYPFLAIFAGYGFHLLLQRKAQQKLMLWIVTIFFANALFDIARNFNRIIQHIHALK